jgi:hypothetical protein
MENLNKKISKLEKALTEMKRELTTIKNSAYNTNATNSLNVSHNNKNNTTLKTNRENIQKAKNILKLSKNYFQLADKEKVFPNEKKLVKNTHSFNLSKKGLNIYNNIFLNSDNKNTIEEKYKTIEKEQNDEFIDYSNQNRIKYDLILGEDKKVNNYIKINDDNINKSFKDHFRNKNQDLFFNYKLNNQKIFKRYFTNNISINKIGKKNSFNSFNKKSSKKLIKYEKNPDSTLFHIKKKKKIKDKNFEDLINNKYIENNEEKTDSYERKKIRESKKMSKIKYYIPQENYKYNYSNQNNIINSYKSSLDENVDYTNYLLYNRNDNKIKNGKVEKLQKEKIIKEYSQILNILGDKSINNLISKSNIFDKYGSKGFDNYINNKGYTISNNNLDIISKYLNEYKNYISSIGKKDELGEEIQTYKLMCNKLIKMADVNDINQLIEDANFKIRKNSNNKNMLEKVKNILNAY